MKKIINPNALEDETISINDVSTSSFILVKSRDEKEIYISVLSTDEIVLVPAKTEMFEEWAISDSLRYSSIKDVFFDMEEQGFNVYTSEDIFEYNIQIANLLLNAKK